MAHLKSMDLPEPVTEERTAGGCGFWSWEWWLWESGITATGIPGPKQRIRAPMPRVLPEDLAKMAHLASIQLCL